MDTFDRGHHSGPVSSWASWATAAALVMVVVTLHVSTKRTHVTVEDAFTAATHEPSAFVSWPGAEQYPSFDSAALVRIHLSPQVVAELGLPVPQAASSDIPADVLVGQDGLARFVRLAASPSPTTDPRY